MAMRDVLFEVRSEVPFRRAAASEVYWIVHWKVCGKRRLWP